MSPRASNFLVQNNLLVAAARQQVDYDTIDSDSGGSEGLINTDLPPHSFLPLLTVIKLHYTNPELFDWCNSAPSHSGEPRGSGLDRTHLDMS